VDSPLLPALPGYDNPQLIAHGTTALVFRAIQTKLNRPVAIKVITADTGSVPVNAARELATTVALSSQPHIVSIIDTGMTDDERPYIVMEYCEGGSYAQILRQRGPLPTDDVVEVGIKIGEALHAAHQVGIVHRDVKPSNILRSRFGPALTDFGIARAPDELSGTLTREMMTPHHASPEALLHQAQSGPSDVYSLASTMWALLVGRPPFVDASRSSMDIYAFRDRVLHDPLPPLPRDDVPAWLLIELTRAMAKLPSQRHGTALEFAEALRRGTLGLPAPAPSREPPAGVPLLGRPVGEWIPARPTTTTPEPAPAAAPGIASAPASPGLRSAGSAATGATREGEAPKAPMPARAERAPSGPAPMPARAERAQSSTVMADDGGWLGPPAYAPPARFEPTVAPLPLRHFADGDLQPPRRVGLVVALIAAAVLAIAGTAVLMLVEDRPGQVVAPTTPPSPTPAAQPTTFITGTPEGAPRQVQLADRGTSVTLTWVDPSGGVVPFLVIGSGSAGEKLETKQVDRGGTSVTYSGLERDRNYCFVVGAVYAVDRVATATQVCTRR
jgi:serine/threonine-protein kinase PknK